MDLASVVASLASVGVRVSGSTPNNNIQGDSSRACPTGLAGPEPSGTHNDPGQHFQPPMDRTTPVTPALLPAQGRQRDGTRQSDPPPYRPPRPHKRGARRTPPPPPPARPPAHERHEPAPRHAAPTGRADQGDRVGPPHPHARAHSTWIADPNSLPSGRAVGGGGAHDPRRPRNSGRHPPRGRPSASLATPSQVGGNRDRTAPPQARQTEQGTGAGYAEGHGPRGTTLPAPSAGTARGAHATPPRGGGSGRRGSASAHTQRARGDYQKGNRTEHAERTDRVEWRTSERG